MLNRILGRVLAGAAMVAALAAVPAVAEEQFSLARFGGAAAGQSVATVQRALRDDLAPIDGNADPECHFRQAARRFPNLRIMVEKGVVTRFDTKDPQYATSAGVRVGDPELHAGQRSPERSPQRLGQHPVHLIRWTRRVRP